MKVKSVSYGRTASKDFQSKRVDVTIDLDAGDTFDGALEKAKVLVAIGLGETPTAEQIAAAREIIAFDEALKSAAKPGKVKR
jgi:hypothetical protein